ncbi:MAG TPA: hypothetical protein PKU94_06445 [Candidatus Hydrothermia bacterium]|nr:hypothetical protein [Candidatus Hydrothermia bacterium]
MVYVMWLDGRPIGIRDDEFPGFYEETVDEALIEDLMGVNPDNMWLVGYFEDREALEEAVAPEDPDMIIWDGPDFYLYWGVSDPIVATWRSVLDFEVDYQDYEVAQALSDFREYVDYLEQAGVISFEEETVLRNLRDQLIDSHTHMEVDEVLEALVDRLEDICGDRLYWVIDPLCNVELKTQWHVDLEQELLYKVVGLN